MPFTLAHPAAVVPLARLWRHPYAFSALVIGSMTPDFEYFLRLKQVSTIGHEFSGSFVFCLPMGLLALILFHGVVKDPIVALFPDRLRRRLCGNREPTPLKPWHVVALGLLVIVGALTHLFWDGFTHNGGWVVEFTPALKSMIRFAGLKISYYRILQHVSTFIGLGILILAAFRWLWRQPPTGDIASPFSAKLRWGLISALILTAMLIGAVVAFHVTAEHQGVVRLRIGAVRFVVVAMAMLAALILSYSLAFRAIRGK